MITNIKIILKTLWEKIKNPLIIFYGAFFIFWIVYRRLLQERLPVPLVENLVATALYFQVLFYSLFLVINIYLVILNIKIIYNKKQKTYKWLYWFYNTHAKSLILLNKYIIEKTFISKYIGEFLESIGLFLHNRVNTTKKKTAILLLGFILPKILFLSCFIVDIFIYQEFNYIFKMSFLLLIPLLCNYLHYLIYYFCEENIKLIDEILIFSSIKNSTRVSAMEIISETSGIIEKTGLHAVSVQLTEEFKNKHKNETYSIKATINHFDDLFKNFIMPIKHFEMVFDWNYKKQFLPYFNIILYSGYTLCWSYILFHCL